MADNSRRISWFKQSNTQWQTSVHRTYTGTIDYSAGANPYQLTITPGPTVTTHTTLGIAKNAFRKYLLDKPVQ